MAVAAAQTVAMATNLSMNRDWKSFLIKYFFLLLTRILPSLSLCSYLRETALDIFYVVRYFFRRLFERSPIPTLLHEVGHCF